MPSHGSASPGRSTSPTSSPPLATPRLGAARQLPSLSQSQTSSSSSALIRSVPIPHSPSIDFTSAAIRTPAHFDALIRGLAEYDEQQRQFHAMRVYQNFAVSANRQERQKRFERRLLQSTTRPLVGNEPYHHAHIQNEDGDDEDEEDEAHGLRAVLMPGTNRILLVSGSSLSEFANSVATDAGGRIVPADDDDEEGDGGESDGNGDSENIDLGQATDTESDEGDTHTSSESGSVVVSSSTRVTVDRRGRRVNSPRASCVILPDDGEAGAEVGTASALGIGLGLGLGLGLGMRIDTSKIESFDDTKISQIAGIEDGGGDSEDEGTVTLEPTPVAAFAPMTAPKRKKGQKMFKKQRERERARKAAEAGASATVTSAMPDRPSSVGLGLSINIEAPEQAHQDATSHEIGAQNRIVSPCTESSDDESVKTLSPADDSEVFSPPTSPPVRRQSYPPVLPSSAFLLSDDEEDPHTIRVNLPPPPLARMMRSRPSTPSPSVAQLEPVPEEPAESLAPASLSETDEEDKAEVHEASRYHHGETAHGVYTDTPQLLTPADTSDTATLPSVHIALPSANTSPYLPASRDPPEVELPVSKDAPGVDVGAAEPVRKILVFGSIVVGDDLDDDSDDEDDDDDMPTREQLEQLTSFAPRPSPHKVAGTAEEDREADDEDAVPAADAEQNELDVIGSAADGIIEADQPDLIVASPLSSDGTPSTPTTPIPEAPTLAPQVLVGDPSPLPPHRYLSPPHLPGSPLRNELLPSPSPALSPTPTTNPAPTLTAPHRPTTSPWSLFFSDTDKSRSATRSSRSVTGLPSAEAYSDNLVPLFSASNLVDLFGSWKALRRQIATATGRNIEPPNAEIMRGHMGLGLHTMSDDNNLHFFVKGVKPMWEDTMCAHGGKFMFAGSNEKMDSMFFDIVLILISDQLSVHCPAPEGSGSFVVGATLSRRSINTRAEIWLGGPVQPAREWVKSVQAYFVRELGGEKVYEYKPFHGAGGAVAARARGSAGAGGAGGVSASGRTTALGQPMLDGKPTPPTAGFGALPFPHQNQPQRILSPPVRAHILPMGRGYGIGRSMSAVIAGEKPNR